MAFSIGKIGVIGAGLMGNGISHLCSLGGHDIYLMDADGDQLKKAQATIEKNMGRQVSKGNITEADKQAALQRITTGTGLDGFKDCDLVVEAVTENEQVKKDILKSLCPVLSEHTLLASNTSSISITRLAAATDRPGKFLGLHFMNPVPMMELVEMIRGIATDPETFEAARQLVLDLGKVPVPAEDFPAFIVNRILMPMINEAVYTLYEGVGTVNAIDTSMKLGLHHPMGPLELADFIGLDTCLAIINMLYEGLSDSKYRPCPLLVKYVEANWLGRKTGRGFYDYSGDEPEPTR
jgi:3-hydroxybutyryl-CoA dehydrogenase